MEEAIKSPIKTTKTRLSAPVEIGGVECFLKVEKLGWRGPKRLLRILLPMSWRLVKDARQHRDAFAKHAITPRPLALVWHSGRWYFLSEAVPGESMSKGYFASNIEYRLSPVQRRALLDALLALHAAQIEHRDLHHGNVIIGDERVWIVDFATSRHFRSLPFKPALKDLVYLAASLYSKLRVQTLVRFSVEYLIARGITSKHERREWLAYMTKRFDLRFVGREDQRFFVPKHHVWQAPESE